MYPNITKFMPFVYETKPFLTNQKCFMITGEKLGYLTAFFNSSLFKFCFYDSFPCLSVGRELSKIFFQEIPVLQINNTLNKRFESLVKEIQKEYTKEKAIEIDNMLFELYNLTSEEKEAIGFVEIQ